MYCKMWGIGNGAILKKKNVCKIMVELYCGILVRFSIFSIHLELIVYKYSGLRVLVRYDVLEYEYLSARAHGVYGPVQ